MKATVSFGVGGVNVRRNSSVGSKRLDALEPGHAVVIDKERDGWVHIKYQQAGDDCEGWAVRSAFVIEEEPIECPVPVEPTPVVIEQPAERSHVEVALIIATVAAAICLVAEYIVVPLFEVLFP